MKRYRFSPLVVFLFLGAMGCKTKELQYLGFEHPRVLKMGFPNSTLALDVRCYNPNRFGLKLTSLNSDVFINNEYLGRAVVDSVLDVPRLDSFTMPVKMNVKMGPAVTGLMKLFSSQTDTMSVLIKLKGQARLQKGALKFGYPIQYEERKNVKF